MQGRPQISVCVSVCVFFLGPADTAQENGISESSHLALPLPGSPQAPLTCSYHLQPLVGSTQNPGLILHIIDMRCVFVRKLYRIYSAD